MAKRKWIKSATANSHGQFAAKADRAGMSTKEFADKEAGAPGRVGKQARLAKTLMNMHHDDGGAVGAVAPMTTGMDADVPNMPAGARPMPRHKMMASRSERMYGKKSVRKG